MRSLLVGQPDQRDVPPGRGPRLTIAPRAFCTGVVVLACLLLSTLTPGLVLTYDGRYAAHEEGRELILTLDPCASGMFSLAGAAGLFLPAVFIFVLPVAISGIPSADAAFSGVLFGEPRFRPPAFRV